MRLHAVGQGLHHHAKEAEAILVQFPAQDLTRMHSSLPCADYILTALSSRSRSPPSRRTADGDSTVTVRHLTKNVKESHVQEIFSVYGDIRRISLPTDTRSGVHRGTAIVVYHTVAAANKAVSHMNKGQIDGSSVAVEVENSRSPSPGYRRGGPGGGINRGPPARRASPVRRRSPIRRSRSPRKYSGHYYIRIVS